MIDELAALANHLAVKVTVGQHDALLDAARILHAQGVMWAAYSLVKDDAKLYDVILGAWQELRREVPPNRAADAELLGNLGQVLAKQIQKTMELS